MKKVLTVWVLGLVVAGMVGCANTNSTVETKRGAVAGSAAGAVVGGIIGHQSGRGLEGAAIGAGAGGLGGAAVGSARDEQASGKAGQPVTEAVPEN